MANPEERIIFCNRTKPWLLLLPVTAGAALAGAGFLNSDLGIDLMIVALTVIILFILFWAGFWLFGQNRIAQIVQRGDRLICKRGDFLNRGSTVEIPVQLIEGWTQRTVITRFGFVEVASFRAGGHRFSMVLTHAEILDNTALRALIAGRYKPGAGSPAPSV